METVRLGQSGLRVSAICLGTMTFGREADRDTSFAIMDAFRERGGFFLDTADIYAKSASEEIVGQWIESRGLRHDIVLATKVFGKVGPGPNEYGLSRIHMIREVEESLRRLRTDEIDLYQIHRWHPEAPVEETARALDDLIRQGKVRYVGSSNLRAYQLLNYLTVQRDLRLDRFISHQPQYSAVNRSIELETLPVCSREGLGVISYNPLAGGLLTGKYASGQKLPAGTRLDDLEEYRKRYLHEEALAIASHMDVAARERGMSPAQLALAWVIAEPRITAPIVGARTVQQLTDTLGALDHPLSPEERAKIPAVPAGRWIGEDIVYDR